MCFEECTCLTLTNQYGTYSVNVKKQDLAIDQVIEELVVPVLCASGYHTDLVHKYVSHDDYVSSPFVNYDDFYNKVMAAGWRPTLDAQHDGLQKLWTELFC